MMQNTLILSGLLSLAWVAMTNQVSPQGFIVGYIFGFGIILLIQKTDVELFGDGELRFARLPGQFVALLRYGYDLSIDIIRSGYDVAWRILRREVDIKPGFYCVQTRDDDPVVAALSAHAITITPGSLVVDYDYAPCGEGTMYVHVLDKEDWTQERLDAEQVERVGRIRKVLGYDE